MATTILPNVPFVSVRILAKRTLTPTVAFYHIEAHDAQRRPFRFWTPAHVAAQVYSDTVATYETALTFMTLSQQVDTLLVGATTVQPHTQVRVFYYVSLCMFGLLTCVCVCAVHNDPAPGTGRSATSVTCAPGAVGTALPHTSGAVGTARDQTAAFRTS